MRLCDKTYVLVTLYASVLFAKLIMSLDVVLLLLVTCTSDKRGGKCVCLSVCLLARLLTNACMDLDEMLRVDRCRDMDELINF